MSNAKWQAWKKKNKIKYQELLQRSCFKCNQIKKKMLCHHINNNPNDNRIENLMTLCYNCHSKYWKELHPVVVRRINKERKAKGLIIKNSCLQYI